MKFSSFIKIILMLSPNFGKELYLDPGSGSIFIQLLLAALLGSIFLLKTYWKKLINTCKEFIVKLKRQKDSNDE